MQKKRRTPVINVPKNILIQLTEFELEVGQAIGERRSGYNRSKNVKDQKRDNKRTGVEIDILGAQAELAFYKLIDKFPIAPFMTDRVMSKKNNTDFGDAVLGGFTIDIKATEHQNGKLIAKKSFESNCIDIYGLIVKEYKDMFSFRGFFPAKELLVESRLGVLGTYVNRPCYMASQEELYDFSSCVEKMLDKAS
jgi:hypothetical protein